MPKSLDLRGSPGDTVTCNWVFFIVLSINMWKHAAVSERVRENCNSLLYVLFPHPPTDDFMPAADSRKSRREP